MAPRVPKVENDPSPRRSQQRGGEGQGAGAACDIWPPRCSLWPIGCGSTPAALRPEYSRRNPSHNGTKGEREERGRERRDTAGESSGAGGRGRARAPVTSRCTPRSQRHADATVPHLQLTRDAARRVCASLAPAHRILTPLRAPGTLGQLVTLLLSLRLRARTGPLLRPPRRPRWQHDSLSLAPSIVSPSRLTEFAVFLFLDTKGEGSWSPLASFSPLFSAAVP